MEALPEDFKGIAVDKEVKRGTIYRLRGSEQLVLTLGDVFGGEHRIPDIMVAPISVATERSEASTLDVVATTDSSSLHRPFAVAVWAAAALPVTYLEEATGQLSDDRLLKVAMEVQLGMVDSNLQPPAELVGAIVANGRLLSWHRSITDSMQRYWDGSVDREPVSVVAAVATLSLDDCDVDVDVCFSRRSKGIFAWLFSNEVEIRKALSDSIFEYRNTTIEMAESIVKPFFSFYGDSHESMPADLTISVTPRWVGQPGNIPFNVSPYEPVGATTHYASGSINGLILPGVLERDVGIDATRLSVAANSNLAMCA